MTVEERLARDWPALELVLRGQGTLAGPEVDELVRAAARMAVSAVVADLSAVPHDRTDTATDHAASVAWRGRQWRRLLEER